MGLGVCVMVKNNLNNFEGVRWGVQNSIKIKVGKEAAAPLSGAAAQLPCYLAQNRTETFLDFEYPTFQGAVSNDYSFCPENNCCMACSLRQVSCHSSSSLLSFSMPPPAYNVAWPSDISMQRSETKSAVCSLMFIGPLKPA